MESKYKRLLGNSFWNFLGNAGSKLLSFLLLPFYTKWLGTEGYGFSDLITVYATLFGGVLTLCISDAILIFVKGRNQLEQKEYYSSIMVLSIILLTIWGGIVFGIELMGIKGGFIVENLSFIFGMIVTNFLQTSTQQMSLALNKIRVFSFSGIIHCLSIFGFSYLLIPQYGVKGYVYAMILSNILTALFSVLFASSWSFFSFCSSSKKKMAEIVKYSIPLIPNAIMWWLVGALNRPIMENHLGLSAIGIYAVAQKFPGIITMLFTIFSVSWKVSVLEEYSKDGFEEFYKRVYHVIFSLLTISTILLMLFSKEIIRLLTAPDFHEAYKYMAILIIGAVFSSMSSFWGTCFAVLKKSKYFLFSSIWGALTAVSLNFLLIPKMGIYGAVISVVISFGVTAIARYFYNLHFVKTRLSFVSLFYTAIMIVNVLTLLLINVFAVQIAVCLSSIVVIILLDHYYYASMVNYFIAILKGKNHR